MIKMGKRTSLIDEVEEIMGTATLSDEVMEETQVRISKSKNAFINNGD